MLKGNQLKFFIVALLAFVLSVGIIIGVYFWEKDNFRGAVVANGAECASIGKKILEQGGSAVDAAIATLFCDGVTCPQSMGLGGGFFMVVYTKRNRRVSAINARETAPAAATEDMYVDNPAASHTGGLSIAIPGELKGYWEAYQEYGRLPWHKLVEPTIDLCTKGHRVSSYLASILKRRESIILAEPSLREIFINPVTNQTWVEGDLIKRPALAKSLEIIAAEGGDALYSRNGSLFNDFMKDLKEYGSIITEDDILNYKVQWTEPVVNQLDENYQLFSMPLPGSGLILSFILNIIKGYDHFDGGILSYHRLVEAFKFAYAERSYLGDPGFVEGIEERLSNLTSDDFAAYIRSRINDEQTYNDYGYYGANWSIPIDHGTAHVSVLTADGDAVAATSTVNLVLGSKLRSRSTGIVLNDEMDDFSTPGQNNEFGIPPSPSNYIRPGKRPMSSMNPTIIIDKEGNPVMVIGSAGGTKITTAVASVILNHLYKGMSIEEAVSSPRIHHQLAPMHVEYEEVHDPSILDLQRFQHQMRHVSTESGFAAVVAISNKGGNVRASFDPRRGGSIGYMN